MKKKIQFLSLPILIMLASVFPAGCDKSKVIHSWADPDASGYSFSKPIAVAVFKDKQLRKTTEDAIVSNVKKVKAYPSYQVLKEEELEDAEGAKKILLAEGYDGAIVMRLVWIENKMDFVAASYPNYYYSYWSYYSTSWSGAVYSPAYIREDRIIQIETTLFSITDNKLLWVGISESKNPESVSGLVDEIAEVIGKELRKRGIIK
jgi:hypothetical protein